MKAPTDPSPELAALLRLKRYEQPPPGYVEEMVRRVQQRQRTAWQQVTPWQWWKERMAAAWSGAFIGPAPRFATVGVAVALVAGVVWLGIPKGDQSIAVVSGQTRAKVTPQNVLPPPESAHPMPGVRLVSDGTPDEEVTESNNGLRRTAGDHWVLPFTTDRPGDTGSASSVTPWDERVVLVR